MKTNKKLLRRLATAEEISKRGKDFFNSKFGNLEGNRKRDLLNTLFNPYALYNNDGSVKRMITKAQYLKEYDRVELHKLLRFFKERQQNINWSHVNPINDLLWWTDISQKFNKYVGRIASQPIYDSLTK